MLDKFKDECGVFGIFGHPEAANLTFEQAAALPLAGLTAHQAIERSADDGATIVRLLVQWNLVAPQRPSRPSNPFDPVYKFDDVDEEDDLIVEIAEVSLIPHTSVLATPPPSPRPPTSMIDVTRRTGASSAIALRTRSIVKSSCCSWSRSPIRSASESWDRASAATPSTLWTSGGTAPRRATRADG